MAAHENSLENIKKTEGQVPPLEIYYLGWDQDIANLLKLSGVSNYTKGSTNLARIT